ncbi:MAG: alpha/beta fold hydrolase [Nocardioidaceae bacterium]
MTEFLDVPGGTLAYDVTGEGPLVLCAPGMGDLRQSYRLLIPVLADAGYRVATMDIRGQGESTRGWDSYGQVALGHDMVALVRHLGGPAVVVGQSFTPDSALVAAAALPDDVLGTVLIAPWARTPRLNPVLSLLQRAVVRVPRLWVMFYKSLYRGPRPADFDAYLRRLTASLRGRGGMTALAAMADPASRDAGGHRSRPSTPALIVMGAEDPDFKDPRAEAETMAGDLTGPVETAMIDGVGHYPQAEAPAATGAAMVPFLRSVHGG